MAIPLDHHSDNPLSETVKKLETEKFDLRRENEKLLREMKIVKEQYAARNQQLKEAQDQKIKFETEAKLKSAETNELNKELYRVRRMVVGYGKQKDEVTSKLEETKDKYRGLKRKLSVSSVNESDERARTELEEDLKSKKRKLDEKNHKIQKLEKKLKSSENEKKSEMEKLQEELQKERDKGTSMSTEIANLRESLDEVQSQLMAAQQTIIKKEEEISQGLLLLHRRDVQEKEHLERIRSLLKQTEDLQEKLDSQDDFIRKQTEYVEDLQSQLDPLGDALEEIKTLQERCEKEVTLRKSQADQLEQANSKILELENSIKATIEVHIHQERQMETLLTVKQEQIKHLQFQNGKFANFVEDMKASLEFPESEYASDLNQLEELKDHLKKKFNFYKTVCGFIGKKITKRLPSTSNDQPLAPETTTSKSAPETQSNHAKLSAPPSRRVSLSTLSIPSPPPSISDPPPSETSPPQTSPHATSEAPEEEPLQLFNELMSNVMLSVHEIIPQPSISNDPSNRPDPLKQVTKTVFKKIYHRENIRKRLPGRTSGTTSHGAKFYCVCGITFLSKESLDCHVQKECKERNFKCHSCPRRFYHFGQLKRHTREVHNIPGALEHFVCGCRSCGDLFRTRMEHKMHICPKLNLPKPNPPENISMEAEQEVPIVTSPSPPPQVPKDPILPPPSVVVITEEPEEVDVEIIDLTDSPNPCIFTGNDEDDGPDTITKSPSAPHQPVTPAQDQLQTARHGLDPENENKCICGVPFACAEMLQTHIQWRNRV